MKKIIVTGCNGQLGRAVNQQYAGSTEYELVRGKALRHHQLRGLH